MLELEYRNGAYSRWLAVPVEVYQAFCVAADAFFRRSIQLRYIFLRGSLSPRCGA
ncbi:KTSC domain-containing protein [Pantoea sp. BL1]|uniref:KTSC domain-containing protein n=1 Tax=Pantoea sp. BL1 TaxID=1628190 RepID=UPI0009080662|nr:KTSC domain-containing protein [Pantoea sp. BL1]